MTNIDGNHAQTGSKTSDAKHAWFPNYHSGSRHILHGTSSDFRKRISYYQPPLRNGNVEEAVNPKVPKTIKLESWNNKAHGRPTAPKHAIPYSKNPNAVSQHLTTQWSTDFLRSSPLCWLDSRTGSFSTSPAFAAEYWDGSSVITAASGSKTSPACNSRAATIWSSYSGAHGGLTAAYLLQDRSRLAVDGRQHMITITPSVGEEILVPVDIHQGSRQADAKRQRNAGASARFRQRKREIERNRERDLQRLEVESREWNKKMQDLTTERDYFRSEAERLRKIVAGIPEFSKLADPAQPTPVSSPPSVPSFSVENSPRTGPLPPPQPQSQPSQSHQLSNPYTHSRTRSHPDNTHSSPYDESLTLERPRRRRRTDTEPSPTTGAYPHNTGAPMAMPQSAFGMAHSPHLPPPRLPPLRGLDQPQSTTTPPPASNGPHSVPLTSQSPSGSGYQPYPPTPAPRPEIGWAINQRGPLEGAHRHPMQGSHGHPESLRRPVEQWRHETHSNRPAA
ncbi:hypothetical protein B0T09DRAFT_261058 [Sordaria sp. MPI-SDFR-AT-0083]|nr:hypothetical protein B0T09DRAFT_261058 [Sordaria sp. MPI-SDFR-AT-0083]